MRVIAVASSLGSILAALVWAGVAGCGTIYLDDYTVCRDDAGTQVPCCGPAGNKFPCPPDAGSDADADEGDDEVDAGDDDGGPEAGSSSGCTGQCVQGGGGWESTPSFVWMGKETDPSPEPLGPAPLVRWVDVAFAEPACPVCSCAAPTAGCVLPDSWSVESTACQDVSSPTVTVFDPPVGWDGMCTSSIQIPAGALCNGVPCVESLVVEPPELAPCVPAPALPPEGHALPPPMRTMVLDYSAAQIGSCGNAIDRCIMKTPPGYQLCLVGYGLQAAHSCPDAWPERHTGWENVEEKRFCSTCSCGAPQGGFCEVRVKAYADAACGNEQGSMVLTSSDGVGCVDLVSGTALGSKTAELLSYEPGSCQSSGGELIGEPLTEWPVTYCCLSAINPPP